MIAAKSHPSTKTFPQTEKQSEDSGDVTNKKNEYSAQYTLKHSGDVTNKKERKHSKIQEHSTLKINSCKLDIDKKYLKMILL